MDKKLSTQCAAAERARGEELKPRQIFHHLQLAEEKNRATAPAAI